MLPCLQAGLAQFERYFDHGVEELGHRSDEWIDVFDVHGSPIWWLIRIAG
jgi:hypothetical protein